MNDIITDVKSLELETIKNLKHSKADNTVRAYESDFKDFAIFCMKNGLKSLPTEPKNLSIYLTYLSKNCKYSTLKRRIASIKVVHKMKGHYGKSIRYKKDKWFLSDVKKTIINQ